MKVFPRSTVRFCKSCMTKTNFIYNLAKRHSYCEICGGWKALDVTSKGAIRFEKWMKRKGLKREELP